MKCARCGHKTEGASWYCANCGAAITDLNVADSGRRRPLPPLLRWSLWLAGATLGLVGLAVLAIGLSRRGEEGAPGTMDALRQARATASASAVEAAPERVATLEAARAGEAPGSPGSAIEPAVPGELSAPTIPAGETVGGFPLRAGDQPWPIRRVEVPPSIDGRLEDWEAPFTLAEPRTLSKVVFGTENWDGNADLGAEAMAAWDAAALYLGVRVLDDVFSQPSTGNLLYRGDSLELQLDVRLAEDFDEGVYSADDWQLGISPGDLQGATRGPEAWVWRPGTRAGAAAFPIGTRLLDDGYVVEAAIPWSLFDIDPETLGAIGFALNVSDNDLPSPEQLTMISSSSARLWGDPRSFGTLVLER